MNRTKDRSISFLGFSFLLHMGLALLLTIAPSLVPLPEGTVSMMEVEFTPVEVPKGNQIKTLDVGQKEAEVPSEPAKPLPEAKEIIPEQKPEEVVVAPPPAPKKQKAAKVLPPKAEKIKITPVKTEVAEESPVPVEPLKNIEEESDLSKLAEEELDKDLEKLDVAGAKNEEKGVEELEEIDRELEKEAEAALAAAALADEKAKKEEAEKLAKAAAEEKKQQPAPPALVTGLPQKSQNLRHESNMNYGVPTGVRDVKELVQAPGNVPPQYPAVSRKRREMGQVQLMYFVTNEGRVSQMRLIKSSGYPELDQEALTAIQKYRFRPGQAGNTSHTVNFILYGDAKPTGGTLRTSSSNDVNKYNSGLRN